MILSIIIPVYNEDKTVIEVLKKIKNNLSNLFKYEIIVIDDNSEDGTKQVLKEIKSSKKNFAFHIRKKKKRFKPIFNFGYKKNQV